MELVATICEELPSIRPVLLGGPPEVELNAALARLPNFSGIDLTGRTPPETLLGVLASCKAVVTVCNGISHFAAAAGARIIQVSGPTNRHVTGPYGVDTRYVSRNLACSPCYRRGFRYGCGKPVCMDISADPILVALKSAIYNR
jgi:ADP-heptose:LPS heptosyltransferase